MSRVLAILLVVCVGAVITASEWPTDGGNPQRTNWQQNESILSRQNVANLKILWKVKLDNAPRQMHSLLPALIAEQVRTSNGMREIVVQAGVSDNIYAIDAANGEILWKKHFDYPPPARSGGAL